MNVVAFTKSIFLLLYLLQGAFDVFGDDHSHSFSSAKIGKRLVVDNFVGRVEAEELLNLSVHERVHFNSPHKGLEEKGLHHLAGMYLIEKSNATVGRWYLTAYKVRDRIFRAAKHHFNVKDMYIEASIFNIRMPGEMFVFNSTEWSHGVHVDNCVLQIRTNMTCQHNPKTFQRHFTAILYLNAFEHGGELRFIDGGSQQTVKPTSSRLVLFTSGPENVHGVSKLLGGERFTFSLWFSLFSRFSSDYKLIPLMLGSPWYRYLDKHKGSGSGSASNLAS